MKGSKIITKWVRKLAEGRKKKLSQPEHCKVYSNFDMTRACVTPHQNGKTTHFLSFYRLI